MCGKEAIISDEHNSDKNKQKRQRLQQVEASNMIVEQIDGKGYTFHTTDCVLIFKKLSDVYGSNFADE